MDHTACELWIDPACCVYGRKGKPSASHMPVKIEVVTEEGECFVIAMTRLAWTKLILGGQEVPGWIEPLEVEDEDE